MNNLRYGGIYFKVDFLKKIMEPILTSITVLSIMAMGTAQGMVGSILSSPRPLKHCCCPKG